MTPLALLLIEILVLAWGLPGFAQDANWQTFTVPDHQMSVNVPGVVTPGPPSEDETFQAVSNGNVFSICEHKLSDDEQSMSDDALWKAYFKGISEGMGAAVGTKPTTVEERSGGTYKGKGYTLELMDKPKLSGVYALGWNRDMAYSITLSGPLSPYEADRFLRSLVVREISDPMKGVDKDFLYVGILGIVGGVIYLVRRKKK